MNIDIHSLEYEDRYVAFIDILGFKDMICKSEDNEEVFNVIITALSKMKKMKERSYKREDDTSQIALFSDNIVISYLIETEEDECSIIHDVMYLHISLLMKGIMVRGGITKGKLCHKGNFVFGPALVRAHEMESKYAIYPRIIIDGNMGDGYDLHHAVDFDGARYIDTLSRFSNILNFKTEIYDIYYHIQENLLLNLETVVDMGVKNKLQWLQNYCRESFILNSEEVKILDKRNYRDHKVFKKNVELKEEE